METNKEKSNTHTFLQYIDKLKSKYPNITHTNFIFDEMLLFACFANFCFYLMFFIPLVHCSIEVGVRVYK